MAAVRWHRRAITSLQALGTFLPIERGLGAQSPIAVRQLRAPQISAISEAVSELPPISRQQQWVGPALILQFPPNKEAQ